MRPTRFAVAALPLFFVLALLQVDCAPGGLATALVRLPKYSPPGETSCGVVASPTRPLVVEWPALDRRGWALLKQGCAMNDPWSCTRLESRSMGLASTATVIDR